MDELISVVVPIYNVEKYLKACVDSLTGQTYQNLEIILVDDGSPDKCPEICDHLAEKDSRIKVIHKVNGGLSDARNAGLRLARGNYITFVDSDDMLAPSFAEDLYRTLKKNDADISFCDFEEVEEERLSYTQNQTGTEQVYTGEELLKEMYRPREHGIQFIAWSKLYKRDLFIENEIEYPTGKLHEDTFTTYKVIYAAGKVAYMDAPRYAYRIRNDSIMRTRFNPKRLDAVEACHQACQFFESKNNPELLALAFNALLSTIVSLYKQAADGLARPEAEPILNQLRKSLSEALVRYEKKVPLPMKKKLFYTVFCHFPSRKLARMITG